MINEALRYVCDDGKEFKTRTDAETHEFYIKVLAAFDDAHFHGMMMDEIVDWFFVNYTLTPKDTH